MPTLRYLHYDVFTTTPFEGNQLAVFLDARGLDTGHMLALTREMNFSESTFILPAEREDTDIRMRIFTPGAEMPMAGHPTVGSTFALARERVIVPGRDLWTFGLNIGPTPVGLEWADGDLRFAWMDQRPPDFRAPVVPVDDVLRAAGVSADAVKATGLPVQEVSCGVPFLYVPLATRAEVDAAEPDMAAMRRLKSAFSGDHVAVFLFSAEPVDADVTVYSRMFAPGLGVAEDAGTGAASGPLGSYLVHHGVVPRERAGAMVSLQGAKMGRPCRIAITIDVDGAGVITRVRIGGAAVCMGEGTITY